MHHVDRAVEATRAFLQREGVTTKRLFSPAFLFRFIMRHRFLQFLIVGTCGVGINLGITWFLTTFVFGLSQYFFAYLFGAAANLAFNFTLYTLAIFKTTGDHARRLAIFILYSLAMTYVQANIVRAVTLLVGLQFYLIVIVGTILAFAGINFIVFKASIFRVRD